MKKIAIIGSGAAGMFAAYRLLQQSTVPKFRITIIDTGRDVEKRRCVRQLGGKDCVRCDPCHILCGVGGAGTFSSGILNLHPKIGGDWSEFCESDRHAQKLIDYVDETFLKFGAPIEKYTPSQQVKDDLCLKAAGAGIHLIPINQRLMGTENTPDVITKMKDYLQDRGVKFELHTEVENIHKDHLICSTRKNPSSKLEIPYDLCLGAPGRYGLHWMSQELEKLGVETQYDSLDIGVRVEVPSSIMKPICTLIRDPKFHIFTKTYDDFVRTFCTNHEGEVVQEVYENDLVGVNGISYIEEDLLTENSNFAFLVRIALTEPLEDTTAYGRSIASQFSILGGKKPIIQRLGDLRGGQRTTWKRLARSSVTPTLKHITPGDISMAMPHRIVTDILEGLDSLNKVIPGVNSKNTLLYAPEVKFSSKKVLTDKSLQTSQKGLYVAGDGAGLTRGIVGAAVTGVLVADGMLKEHF
ncbi:dehydrogenase-related [Anaeramoeba flamelloides]|uniref:Dehydrogenase-related n=1 Tax=Anaeramoeba flamelloides TaxID=1746091 RepID=A0AAV7Y8Z3_9EUKA|nr:dehydrogenase-related [Anaeramoeba flamelloides]KAJ6228236.1 dehydrogenase-related [Anaeramoeba flamelloides]